MFRPEDSAELTTIYGFALPRSRFAPIRAFSERNHFFTARPPLLFKEGNGHTQKL